MRTSRSVGGVGTAPRQAFFNCLAVIRFGQFMKTHPDTTESARSFWRERGIQPNESIGTIG